MMAKSSSASHSQDLGQYANELQWIDIDFLLEQTNAPPPPENISPQSRKGVLTHDQQIELANYFVSSSSDPASLRLNRWFDVLAYEEARPDVKSAEINSSLHYFMQGFKEIDQSFRGGAPLESILRHRANRLIGDDQYDPISISRDWQNSGTSKDLQSGNEIRRKLESCWANAKAVVFSFSHDNAFASTGGIQKIIRVESSLFRQENFCYIHISPSNPLPFINDILQQNPCRLCVDIRVDGVFIGSVLQIAIARLIEQCDTKKTCVIFHHFFGFNVGLLRQLINRYSTKRRLIWWVHDYSLNCLNFTLMRDELEFCGSPSILSPACKLCKFGEEREKYLKAIQPILSNTKILFIHPSRAALRVSDQGDYGPADTAEKLVVPHASIKSYEILEKNILLSDRKCRVAFVGQPVRHKGWDEFVSLISNASLSAHYEWLHIGKGHINVPITSIYMDGTSELNSMENLLKENLIDIVFVWPLWPETFCIVALEAFCAGCHIITNTGSGNIQEFFPVETRSIFESIDDVHQWLFDLPFNQEIKLKTASNISIQNSSYTLDVVASLLSN
jgi:glycosyltransferase involved in cell wall biosynthesis